MDRITVHSIELNRDLPGILGFLAEKGSSWDLLHVTYCHKGQDVRDYYFRRTEGTQRRGAQPLAVRTIREERIELSREEFEDMTSLLAQLSRLNVNFRLIKCFVLGLLMALFMAVAEQAKV